MKHKKIRDVFLILLVFGVSGFVGIQVAIGYGIGS